MESVDKIIVKFKLDENKNDLSAALKSIKNFDETSPSISSYKTKDERKKEKKKKKKGLIDEDNFILSSDLSIDNDENDDKVDPEDIFDIDDLLNSDDDYDEDEYDEDGNLINEQRREYRKNSNDKNEFKKEFKDELTLLYGLLDELNKFGKDIEKKYKGIESAKVRGVSKYTNDLILSILTCKNNKLSVLREIANIKKTIVDLKLKAEKDSKANTQNTLTSEAVTSAYLKNIVNYGRNNFLNDVALGKDLGETEEFKDNINISKLIGNFDNDNERYNNEIDERLNSLKTPYRNPEVDQYMKYENLKPKILIKRDMNSGDWRFMAVDKNNMEIPGYPVPTKTSVGKIRFSSDGTVASDATGRSYKVLEIF